MKSVEEIISYLEREIEILKNMVVNTEFDDDKILDHKVFMRSSLICSYMDQIKLLNDLKKLIMDGEKKWNYLDFL